MPRRRRTRGPLVAFVAHGALGTLLFDSRRTTTRNSDVSVARFFVPTLRFPDGLQQVTRLQGRVKYEGEIGRGHRDLARPRAVYVPNQVGGGGGDMYTGARNVKFSRQLPKKKPRVGDRGGGRSGGSGTVKINEQNSSHFSTIVGRLVHLGETGENRFTGIAALDSIRNLPA